MSPRCSIRSAGTAIAGASRGARSRRGPRSRQPEIDEVVDRRRLQSRPRPRRSAPRRPATTASGILRPGALRASRRTSGPRLASRSASDGSTEEDGAGHHDPSSRRWVPVTWAACAAVITPRPACRRSPAGAAARRFIGSSTCDGQSARLVSARRRGSLAHLGRTSGPGNGDHSRQAAGGVARIGRGREACAGTPAAGDRTPRRPRRSLYYGIEFPGICHAMSTYRPSHLRQLEAESIHIIREVAARVREHRSCSIRSARIRR